MDFYIISDRVETAELYPNVRTVKGSISDFNLRAKRVLGAKYGIDPKRPYKLCDYRPVFGLIYDDFIEHYRYWGYGDIDLIFGSFGNLLTPDYLGQYDYFGCHPKYSHGAFSLWRNCAEMKNLFRLSKHWQETLLNNRKFFAFDECGVGNWDRFIRGEVTDPDIFDSMTHIILRQQKAGQLKAHMQYRMIEFPDRSALFRWRPGELVCVEGPDQSERVFLHFVMLKRATSFWIPPWYGPPREVFLNWHGLFYSAEEARDPREIRRRRFRGVWRRLKRPAKLLNWE